jgi:hypothetical protein
VAEVVPAAGVSPLLVLRAPVVGLQGKGGWSEVLVARYCAASSICVL